MSSWHGPAHLKSRLAIGSGKFEKFKTKSSLIGSAFL